MVHGSQGVTRESSGKRLTIMRMVYTVGKFRTEGTVFGVYDIYLSQIEIFIKGVAYLKKNVKFR